MAARRRHLFDPHQGDRSRRRRAAPAPCCWPWTPRAARRPVPGERTTRARLRPARALDRSGAKEEAMFRGCTVVDPPSVLTTHLTELVRENMAELLSYAETQKLLDELPREQQKLVADLIPSQITVGGVQRVLQSPAGRARLDPRPADHPGRHPGSLRRAARAIAGDRRACARPAGAPDQRRHTGPGGYIPLVTLSAGMGGGFAEALVGPPEDRQLAMAPTQAAGVHAAPARARSTPPPAPARRRCCSTSGAIRAHVRAIVERYPAGDAGAGADRDPPRARASARSAASERCALKLYPRARRWPTPCASCAPSWARMR